MRRLFVLLLVGLLLAVTTATALAGTDRTMVRLPETTESFYDDVGVCDSGPGWVTVTWRGHFSEMVNPNGVHLNALIQGSFRFIPDDPTYPAFGGHVSGREVFNMNRGAQTASGHFILTGRKDDGTPFRLRVLGRFTATPSGHVFQIETGRCVS